jgi:ribosomal protein S18 acetylase RimI-like enzyme
VPDDGTIGHILAFRLPMMPDDDQLSNPIWHALVSRHANLAIGNGPARRYPPSVTPFMGAIATSPEAAAALADLAEPGERVGILGVLPPVPWPIAKEIEILQYAWGGQAQADRDPNAVVLGEEHIPAMLELTALVYPAYFRPGTARLGTYLGFFEGGQLIAMAGTRMALLGFQELSAICTHPDFRGQGLAARLTRHLVREILDQGEVPFLHTESDNPAQGMYEKLGFRLHQRLPFHVYEVA